MKHKVRGGRTIVGWQIGDAISRCHRAAMKDRSINLISCWRFPRGGCGDARDLLACYLAEDGVRTTEVVEVHQQGTLEEWLARGKILAEGARVEVRWAPSICKSQSRLVSKWCHRILE